MKLPADWLLRTRHAPVHDGLKGPTAQSLRDAAGSVGGAQWRHRWPGA